MCKQELKYNLVINQPFYGNEIHDILNFYGIKNVDAFLKPTLDDSVIEDPLSFDNINLASDIIIDAVKNKKHFALIMLL